jgi:UDP-perosamine 4-acetyltransferase
VVLGAGGHAKVILDLLEQRAEVDIVGCTCGDTGGRDILGYPVLGADEALPALFASGVSCGFVALGDNELRRKKLKLLRDIGFRLINAISCYAVISQHAILGLGIAVMPGVSINAGTVIEDGAIINTGAIVDHDCSIAECAHVCPGAALAGSVRIGQGALIGTGASVTPGCSVGEWSTVGAGAVVLGDIPARVTAMGIPAVVRKKQC